MILWITGNSGSGKTTLAKRIQKPGEIILDGNQLREVWKDLDLTPAGRNEQNLRAARLAKLLESQGFDVIVAVICPYRTLRTEVQGITGCRFIYLPGGKNGSDYPYECPTETEFQKNAPDDLGIRTTQMPERAFGKVY